MQWSPHRRQHPGFRVKVQRAILYDFDIGSSRMPKRGLDPKLEAAHNLGSEYDNILVVSVGHRHEPNVLFLQLSKFADRNLYSDFPANMPPRQYTGGPLNARFLRRIFDRDEGAKRSPRGGRA